MTVVHVTSWLSRRGGGIPPVIRALARETNRQGISASVVGLEDEWVQDDCCENGFPISTGKVFGPKAFGFSPELRNQVRMRANSPGVIHSHGLWMYPGLAARSCAERKNCRLIISPHGMLEPWALNHSRWKKKVVEYLIERRNLRRADCLHALCEAEADHFRSYGLKNPIAIIPNGIDPAEILTREKDPAGEKSPGPARRRRILFLSRLHSKKGLDNLLQAWKRLAAEFKAWQLVIAGSGEPAYETRLKNITREQISEGSIVFPGAVYGDDKKQVLAGAEAFVLPSFSEGFSMAVLEAAAAGLPVLLTPECNFPELAKSNGAFEISADAAGIEAGIRRMLEMPDGQRREMGRCGQELIKRSYTWPVIAGQMCRIYDWLVRGGQIPEGIKVA